MSAEETVADVPSTQNEQAAGDAPCASRRQEIAFLQDVAEHPDSGVAARYRRLGLSGRQGQKIKMVLLEQGLIEGQLQSTHGGRLMRIRLTEKGRQMLPRE